MDMAMITSSRRTNNEMILPGFMLQVSLVFLNIYNNAVTRRRNSS
jgi:hypothetical protein